MKYKYLKEWVLENEEQHLFFDEILKFEDQYKIKFLNWKNYLQISLSSREAFLFFTDNDILPFTQRAELDNFNTHLNKSKLEKLEINNDRIISLLFTKIDIYNKKSQYKVILELIPRYGNIIIQKFDSKIIDCVKKISFAENKHRQILPGIKYQPPETNYQILKDEVKYPISITEKGKILENAEVDRQFDNMNDLFNEFYYNWIFVERNEKIRRSKIKKIKKKIKKKKRKIEKLKLEYKDSLQIEKWEHYAELLKANFKKIKNGMEEIKLKNYYKENFPTITIPLNKDKNAQQNIEYYFKKFRKSKSGKRKIAQQIIISRNEVEDLEKEIFEIKEIEYFLEVKKTKKPKKNKSSKFKKISINSDWEICIGRTSKENDQLTTRLAKPYDWWFHTRIFHGTHVLLRNLNKNKLPPKLKTLCCRLAAYYSKAKNSSNVPVDFTQIRYVRKPRKSAPGFVTYENQQTLYVDPLSMRSAVRILEKYKESLTKIKN